MECKIYQIDLIPKKLVKIVKKKNVTSLVLSDSSDDESDGFGDDNTYTLIIPNGVPRIIQLNKAGESYIHIDYLPKITNLFEDMWNLHPVQKHKIIMYEKEVEVNRYSKSYLNTPTDLSHTKTRSYMYSGYDTSENTNELPDVFKPYYDYMKSIDNKYNQVIVNWYENGDDYIALHSDCTKSMIPNAKIAIISLYENSNSEPRYMLFTPKKINETKYKIRLDNETILTMCGKCQKEFQHGINKTNHNVGKRISLSFRQML